MVSGIEDLTDSQANIRADSLIVSPAVALVKPVVHRPVTRYVANFPVKPTPSSQSRPCEFLPQPKSTSLKKLYKYSAKPTSSSSPKLTAKASPLVELKVKAHHHHPQSKVNCTPLQSTVESTREHCSPLQSTLDVQLTSYPSRPHTRSSLKKPDSTPLESTPNPSKPHSNPKHSSRILSKPNCNLSEPIAAPTKSHTKSRSRDDGWHTGPSSGPKKSSSSTSKCLPAFNHLPLVVIGVDELLDFDVEENKWDDSRDAMISIVGAQPEGGRVIVTSVDDNPPSGDNSEDEDFVVDGEDIDDSKDVSLDEENNNSESRNDEQLEVQSQQLPHKVLGSGTTRCKICKHLGHNAVICGRPRDEHGRLLTKRKRRPIEGRVPKPRGRPKKQKATTSTPTPSTTVAVQAGPSTQCSQVGSSQVT
ncbi:hypothetical protein Cgig2_020818 [Carnegiea gigantea]|uniref:Uncharacterized protein n=1 Tax=Carnegiea gigantea TaxID=171969 RepID=A0A9Q1KJR7_9CARY|nr:hypothetical protein Cgig2_020818 [Carnegiea gigantea]